MRLNVKVYIKAKKERLVEEEGRSLVYLTVPDDGPKLNRALVKFLAAHFYVKPECVGIINGLDKREKLIQVIKG